ncbi:sensor domain-containing protein, partial [Ureibacillus acetophenoni]
MAFSLFPKFFKSDETSTENIYTSNKILDYKTFNTLFENHPDLVFTIDPDREIQFFNQTLNGLFNYNENKLRFIINQKLLNIEIVKKHVNRAFAGESQNFQFEYIDTHKRSRNFYVTIVPIFNNENHVNAICGIAKDITNYVQYENEITEIKNKLELAQHTGKIGSWDYNVLSNEIYWSEQLYLLTGRDREDASPVTLEEGLAYIHPEDRERYRTVLYDAMNNSTSYEIEYRILRKDNTLIYVFEHVELLLGENGRPVRLVGNTQDITERKLAEKKLQETKLTTENIYENLSLGIVSIDMITKRTIMVSTGIEEVTGYPKKYFYSPQAMESIVHPEDLHKFTNEMAKITFGKKLNFEFRIIHKNRKEIWIHAKLLPNLNDKGAVVRVDGIYTDITERKQHEEEIRQLAYYDKLTGLPKTELFHEKINSLIKLKNSFSILYLNIHRIKSIKNTLGHEIANEFLIQLTKRLQDTVSQPNFFANLEGNELGIVLWDIKEANSPENIAKKVIDSLNSPFIINGFEIYALVSIGISNYSENGETIEDLLKNADAALHRAKAAGKNNYHIFSSNLNISTYKQYELERDLRKAIKNNQLLLYFQPRVDTNTRRMISAEALIRWEHPTWGIVSPAEFLPIAEEVGLINEIGDWVFQNVCEYLETWKKEGLKLVPISINFIAQRFLRSDCIPMIVNTLKKHKVDTSLIELEITETSIIHHEKEVESIKTQLDEIGINVALDDFGTGYSSLAHIKDFTIGTIKLDKSFVQQIAIKPDVEIIIKSIIFMAKGLNMNV